MVRNWLTHKLNWFDKHILDPFTDLCTPDFDEMTEKEKQKYMEMFMEEQYDDLFW